MIKTLLRVFNSKNYYTTSIKMNEIAQSIFYSAVTSVTPRELITKKKTVQLVNKSGREIIKIKSYEKCFELDITDKNLHLVGFGKGVLALAAEIEVVLGSRLTSGILSVPQNNIKLNHPNIKVIEGAKGNLPDDESMQAAIEIRDKTVNLTKQDVLLCLITGGGSACLSLPQHPITLTEKSSLVKKLSLAGATINELNTVRIAISQVKGGKLVKLGQHAHQIISLVISDIINDPLELIASGPTISFTNSTMPTAREILAKFNLLDDSLPHSIAQVIQESEEVDDATEIKNFQTFLIGNNRVAIDAAMKKAKTFNLIPLFLSAGVQGDVKDISEAFFRLATAIKGSSSSSSTTFKEEFQRTLDILHAQPSFERELLEAREFNSGICIVAGGEPTVKVSGNGLGGRNQELALRFTKLLYDAQNPLLNDILLLSCGTDGIDGNCDAAGGIGGLKILSNINDRGDLSDVMRDFIYRNDSYNFYKEFLNKYGGDGYHITTGHTGTNVMDIQLLIIPK